MTSSLGLSSLRFTNLCLSPVATIATLGEQVPLPYPVTNCYNYFSTSVIQTQLPLQFTVIMLLMLTILNRFNNSKYLFAPCYYFHPPILGWEFLPNISPPQPPPTFSANRGAPQKFSANGSPGPICLEKSLANASLGIFYMPEGEGSLTA